MLLSISFIATSSSINGRQLKGIINGQRTMEYCCDINNILDNKVLYRIYNWIYTDAKEKREPLNDSQFIEYLYNRAYSILYLLRLKS